MKKLILLTAVLLAGCGQHISVTPTPVTYPDSLFECPAKPDSSVIRTDSDLATWMVQIDGDYQICQTKLKNLKDLVTKHNK